MRPSLRTTSPPRNSAIGSASSVADIATTARSGRSRLAQAPQPREREIRRDVALVKLVEHDGPDAGQPRRGQHAAG